MAATHACPGGCGATIPRHKLSCRTDWYRLPKALRDRINDAYRRDRREHAQALVEASAWYREHPR